MPGQTGRAETGREALESLFRAEESFRPAAAGSEEADRSE